MSDNTQTKNARPMTGVDMTTVQLLPMELLHRSPYQVRRETAADVAALAADIQAHGLINPITVRRRSQGDGFEVVAGHRRWAAMRSVDPDAEVPCIVLDVDDRTAEELLVAENFVRADLSIMEQAETVRLLTEHGRTAEECGKVCKRSVRWAHRMRAIGGIGDPWRGFLHAAGLPYGCALAVARLPEAVREDAWRGFWAAVAEDLGVDALEPPTGGWEAIKQALAGCVKMAAEAGRETDLPDGLDLTTDRGARLLLQYFQADPDCGDRFSLDDPRSPLGEPFDRLHALETAPFACGKLCARCARRTDRAPDLFGEDDGRATVARCLDADCWRRHVEEAVQAKLDAAAAAGAAAAKRETFLPWGCAKTWKEALEEADGVAARVTPVVEISGGQPTGRVLFDVAEAEGEGGEDEPTPKRERWEEWRPENPRWMPMLMGDERDRAWFAVGVAIGNKMGLKSAPWSAADKDMLHALVRAPQLAELAPETRAAILASVRYVLPQARAHQLDEVERVYAEARKHLPAKGD